MLESEQLQCYSYCSNDVHGYDWPVIPAAIVAILLAAAFGWALAYPTARLRMDYFAIVDNFIGGDR